MSHRQYITTAIDYPNAAPHMGHVLEKVLADVCARWFRVRGEDVLFQTGTDEHGVKIERKAKEEGMEPQALVDRNVALFEDLYTRLDISYDRFIRTTDREKHWPTVQALWRKLRDAGMLEKRSYTGLYCPGCERFLTQKELVDGLCPDHKTPPDAVTEENWFFLLSKETEWLKEVLKKEYVIVPGFRANETLSLLDQGLEDVSFSRPKKSLAWGIPVPDDDEQTMYVWCDALTNYISGLGFFTNHEERAYWDDAAVTHVIGKDIARFHALIWPAMLKAAGVRLPDRLLIHGFLTSEGQKMSKSIGNVVKPDDVLAHFGGNPDPLRFYLSHEIPVGRDGDFSWERIDALYDAALRKQLGNLLNRVLRLIARDESAVLPVSYPESEQMIADKWKEYMGHMDRMELQHAMQAVMTMIGYGNGFMEQWKPWSQEGDARTQGLMIVAESLRHVALMLLPFVPSTAQKISRQLGVSYAESMLDKGFTIAPWQEWGADKEWKRIGEPGILFPPLEEIGS